jgi:hypothetical protein
MVYKISADLINLGKLDGNETMPSIPIGEEDFKRTVQRIDGLSLTKFSSKLEQEDYIYNITLAFTKIDSLIEFLDTQGQQCRLSEVDGKKILTIVFSSGYNESEMKELIPIVFAGYNFDFKLKVPAASKVDFFNANADKIASPPVGKAELLSRGINYSAPMGDLFSTEDTVAFEIRW